MPKWLKDSVAQGLSGSRPKAQMPQQPKMAQRTQQPKGQSLSGPRPDGPKMTKTACFSRHVPRLPSSKEKKVTFRQTPSSEVSAEGPKATENTGPVRFAEHDKTDSVPSAIPFAVFFAGMTGHPYCHVEIPELANIPPIINESLFPVKQSRLGFTLFFISRALSLRFTHDTQKVQDLRHRQTTVFLKAFHLVGECPHGNPEMENRRFSAVRETANQLWKCRRAFRLKGTRKPSSP